MLYSCSLISSACISLYISVKNSIILLSESSDFEIGEVGVCSGLDPEGHCAGLPGAQQRHVGEELVSRPARGRRDGVVPYDDGQPGPLALRYLRGSAVSAVAQQVAENVVGRGAELGAKVSQGGDGRGIVEPTVGESHFQGVVRVAPLDAPNQT